MFLHGPSCLKGPVKRYRGGYGSQKEKGKRRKEPGIRVDLVERIRREIAAGTYETPEKLQAALDKLLERLDLD